MEYRDVCIAILKHSKSISVDYRGILREYVELVERIKVEGWNRDAFLDEMVKQKKEMEE